MTDPTDAFSEREMNQRVVDAIATYEAMMRVSGVLSPVEYRTAMARVATVTLEWLDWQRSKNPGDVRP